MLNSLETEFSRYRALAEKALAQIDDLAFFATLGPEANSIAVLVKHVGGNLRARFTDFLTTDGEKPWRDRDREFEVAGTTRAELMDGWDRGWAALFGTLAELSADSRSDADAQLARQVSIRGQALSVGDALTRSVAHVAMHVGQIVMLAKHAAGERWQTLSIPRGGSDRYNQDPTRETAP
jgi:hypothetical protein